MWLCFLCSLCGSKKNSPHGLANSYFPIDVSTYIRKVFNQNPSSSIFLMLQLNHTSTAFVGLDLCGYVFYVNYVVQKKYPPPVLANLFSPDLDIPRKISVFLRTASSYFNLRIMNP
jgi:hypothetical protein